MKRLILPVLVLSLLGITAAGAYPTPRTEQATSNELLVDVGHKGVRATSKATSTVTSMATLTSMAESTITATAIGPIATAIVPSAGSSMAASRPGPSGTAHNVGATARG